MRLEGYEAIEAAEANGLLLNKYTDPLEDARQGLTPDEARAIAREDARLVYVDVELPQTKRLVDEISPEYAELTGVLDPTGSSSGDWQRHNVWIAVDDAGRVFVWGNQSQPIGPQYKALMDRWGLKQICGVPAGVPAREVVRLAEKCVFTGKTRYITWGEFSLAELTGLGFLVR